MARHDVDREAWLRLAQGWISLQSRHPQTVEEAFDQRVADEGTKRAESEPSN